MIGTLDEISRPRVTGRFLPMFEFKDGNWATPWRCWPEHHYCESCWLERGLPVRDDRRCLHEMGVAP